jgi:hypothetical protein
VSQPTQPADLQTEQLRIERNLREILAIPFEYCPWPAVRQELLGRVLSGAPIKVYAWYSCTVWKLEDHTYPGKEQLESPREWAIRNGYALDEEAC